MGRRSSSSVKVFYPAYEQKDLVHRIRERLPKLTERLALRFVVLFGSYAKGNYTVASDVDLLVVYSGQVRNDVYGLVKRILNVSRLEPHVYSESEYEKVRETLEKMTKDGLVLFSPNSGSDLYL